MIVSGPATNIIESSPPSFTITSPQYAQQLGAFGTLTADVTIPKHLLDTRYKNAKKLPLPYQEGSTATVTAYISDVARTVQADGVKVPDTVKLDFEHAVYFPRLPAFLSSTGAFSLSTVIVFN